MSVVGVDLGATGIKAGRVDGRGRVVARARAATRAEQGPDAVLDRVAELVASLCRGARVSAIGVGSCGLIDPDDGGRVVVATDTTPGWLGARIGDELGERTGLPAVCDNDGNAAALGEARYGAGRGARVVAMLTLGTGVGGGIVVDGRILRGAGVLAGSLGHLKVRAGGRRCACGARGCLEAYLSAWAFRRIDGRSPEALFRAARRGEPAAQRRVDEAAAALGAALADLAHVLDPEVVVLGGGIARGWPLLRARSLQELRSRALAPALASMRVVRGALGDDAGVVGAAALARADG